MNPTHVSESQTTPGAPLSTSGGGMGASAQNGLKATARDVAGQVRSAASSTATRAREEVQRFATEKKSSAAERIDSYSSAIHESARSLEEKDPNIAWFTHRAADRLQGIADYVRNRDFDEFRHDVEDVARRHPALFFGGLFAAGLLLGNVLKSTRRSSLESTDFGGEESDSSGSAGTQSLAASPSPASVPQL